VVTSSDEGFTVNAIAKQSKGGTAEVLVSLIPEKQGQRRPVDLCCVIDISGSMSSEAAVPTENAGKVERHGLTYLDIVKHSIRTIVATLNSADRLSLVTFSCHARRETGLIKMDTDGKNLTNDVLDHLVTEGSTNLWDGIREGIEVMTEECNARSDATVPSLLIFTDGMPNSMPVRENLHGILYNTKKRLQGVLSQYEGPAFTINTFGFGYQWIANCCTTLRP